MLLRSLLLPLLVLALLSPRARASDDTPVPIDPTMAVSLVAADPEIRTPTAVTVDAAGRIWALENNTHFRPKNYDAPPTDRVLVFEDFGPDGRARKSSVFADGFQNGMGLRLLPDGGVIVSTRAETFLLRDADKTGKAGERHTLLKLETKDDYPHDGLSGMAVSDDGHLFIGLGENHGVPWKLIGSDGSAVSGSDEGGIFRCDLSGAHLERWALGLWNPFGLAFDGAGRLFALDNDPGAGSFCRLLHLVRGGDYGYRYRYGRTIDHPFISWFGQIPGTLPPVCLVGEAPTGLLFCDDKILSPKLAGQLVGCTWNDNGIQRFPLEKRGADFSSKPEWVLRGGHDFRPTGIAEAPDGSLVISDWVKSSYEVHGKGRIWRVRSQAQEPTPLAAASANAAPPAAGPEPAAELAPEPVPVPAAEPGTPPDPFIFHALVESLVEAQAFTFARSWANDPDPWARLAALLSLRRSGDPAARALLPAWLKDPDGRVRRAALQWISEEGLKDLQPELSAALAPPLSRMTMEAWLAALQMLKAGHPDPRATVQQTAQLALDGSQPAELRALALRLQPADHPALALEQLAALIRSPEQAIQVEAARLLAALPGASASQALLALAGDRQAPAAVRAEALPGLASSVESPETAKLLRSILDENALPLTVEALHDLRGHCTPEVFQLLRGKAGEAGPTGTELREQLLLQTRTSPALKEFASDPELTALAARHPAPGQPWPAALQGPADAAAGRRLFFHPNGPRCFTCHTIEGRGGKVGPDLTQISGEAPEKLLESIREPSKEIAPAYTQWLLELKDGRKVNGIDAFEDDKSGVTIIDATGARTRYPVDQIVTREALPVSLMPPGLDYAMTEQEIRDLLAYLRERRD